MFQTNKFSSFMINDILKCDKQANDDQNDCPNHMSMSSLDCNLLTTYSNDSNSYSTYSQIHNYYNYNQSKDNNFGKTFYITYNTFCFNYMHIHPIPPSIISLTLNYILFL